MDNLQKARKLAEHNPYIRKMLDEPALTKQKSYQRKQEKYNQELEALKRLFNDDTEPQFILTDSKGKLLKLPPTKHKLKNKDYNDRLKELKDMTRQPNLPSLRYFEERIEKNKTKPDQTLPDQTDNVEDNVEGITISDTTISIVEQVQEQAQTEILSPSPSPLPSPSPSPLENIEDNEKQKLSPTEKLSRSKKVSQRKPKNNNNYDIKKVECQLAKSLPIVYNTKALSLNAVELVKVYSSELTIDEIRTLFQFQDELRLTHAELTALSLLIDMKTDPKSNQQYWKIQEIMQKTKKSSTPVSKTPSSLLDEKLAEAEEAIFVKNPKKSVDN